MKILKFISGIVLFLISFSITCCKDKEVEQKTDALQITLPVSSKEIHLPADSLFSGKEIIPLETTSECLISNIDKLEIANGRLYILDDQQDIIFIFNQTGRYINKIASIGRGPKEYYELSDFHVDDSLIYITAGSSLHKVMCYDLNGNYQKSFATEYPAQRITTDSNYIYVYYNFSYHRGCNVGIYDKKRNNLIKRYKPYTKQQEGIGYTNRCWTSCKNKVYASFPYEYNIYELTPDSCRVIASIDYGEKYMFPKEWNTFSYKQVSNYVYKNGGVTESPIIHSCNTLYVTSKRTIFTFTFKCDNYICLINNKTTSTSFGIVWPNEYYWNVHGFAPIYASNNFMVIPCESASIISYRNIHGKNGHTQKEWNLNITEDSNPCLYFYRLK